MYNVKVIPANNTEVVECHCQFASIPNLGETIVIEEKRMIVHHRDLLPCKDSDSISAHVFTRNLFERESGGLPTA